MLQKVPEKCESGSSPSLGEVVGGVCHTSQRRVVTDGGEF